MVGNWLRVVTIAFAVLAPGVAHSGLSYDESVDGDLSGNRAAPTQLVLSSGSNVLVGSVANAEFAGDIDYVSVAVPAGHRLSALLLRRANTSGPQSFIAVQSGSTFTVAPQDALAQIAQLLGWNHFGAGDAGSDMLLELGTGDGAQGFSPPLPAGSYTFWIQELAGTTTYSLDFQVTSVPEPAAYALFGAGLALVSGARWLRRRTQASSSLNKSR